MEVHPSIRLALQGYSALVNNSIQQLIRGESQEIRHPNLTGKRNLPYVFSIKKLSVEKTICWILFMA